MWIDRLFIDGYRHFRKQEIAFERNATTIAGPNNSGKTSLIDLLRVILAADKNFGPDDFSSRARLDASRTFIAAALVSEAAFEEMLEVEALSGSVPSIEIRLTVKYDPARDDIREFAEFLMDLDEDTSSFFFVYSVRAQPEKLAKLYRALFPRVVELAAKASWNTPHDISVGSPEFLTLQSLFDAALLDSCITKTEFADSTFSTLVPLERSRFTRLFNFKSIKASRELDDTIEDKSGHLNKRLIDVAKENSGWTTTLAGFPALVLRAIDETGIRAVTSDETVRSLNAVIDSISKTNGASTNSLFVDFQVTEAQAVQLISRAMQMRYSGSGVPLAEGSQGLGYSNLVLLHLETESFIRASRSPEKKYLVNFLVVEEPESHMHPQMQNAFIKHLFKRVAEVDEFQVAVSTHSNEIVKSSSIVQLRVLKVAEGLCRIIDLRLFHESQVETKTTEEQRLFNLLYSINFADILFADKVVMYEGDSERMYLQALIEVREDLGSLRVQYISYVQVGGAYAHIYLPLVVDTLGVKTVVITDLDYPKESDVANPAELSLLATTNSTLNAAFPGSIEEGKTALTLAILYGLVDSTSKIAPIPGKSLAAVAFQTEVDGYARTLEEAILATILDIDVWATKPKSEWETYRAESKLRFSIPRAAESPSVREIVASTSNGKTDFMYSLILKEDFQDDVPPYILAALKWLAS